MPISRWLAMAAATAVATGCGNSTTGYGNNPPPPPPPPPGGHSTTITVANNSFSPTPDTIPAGNITFHWAASAVTHNVTWDSGPSTPAGSGNKAAGDPDFVAALVMGTYHYHCSIHGVSMSGTVVVQ